MTVEDLIQFCRKHNVEISFYPRPYADSIIISMRKESHAITVCMDDDYRRHSYLRYNLNKMAQELDRKISSANT